MSGYIKPSLKKELLDKIQEFIDEYPEYGYRSLAQFIEDAVRRRADDLHVFELIPRFGHFKHFNVLGDHVTIEDKKLGFWVDLYPKDTGELWCEHCKATNCEHVKFALTLPEIMKSLEKRGWKHKERGNRE